MRLPEEITRQLVERGDLWEAVPGIVGMRGALAGLRRSVSAEIGDLASRFTCDEWRMPQGLAFETLERAGYFESFPQWLSGASHLSGDEEVLERIAGSLSPGDMARKSFAAATAALPPAVCYHTYAALRGRSLSSALVMTAEDVCWRHERGRFARLERGWAFTMREIVCVGTAIEAEAFRQRGIEEAVSLAASLGLATRIEVATDPFFAPSARGKALLQRVKSLKHELLFDYPDGRSLAIASFNNHEAFFGDAFDISLADGAPAVSACIAFGIERWMLAILMAHGTDCGDWPESVAADAVLAGIGR